MATKITFQPIRVGDRTTVHGRPARVKKVWPLGTIDVEVAGGCWFRLTGLPICEHEGKIVTAWQISS